MMYIFSILILFWHCVPRVFSAAIDICYLIDDIRDKRAVRHSIVDKMELARNVSRCLLSKGTDAKVAAIVYDNDSAKLGFNFRNIDDLLNDGFQKIIVNKGTNIQVSNQANSTYKRATIRLFNGLRAQKSLAANSPQTMAFLTAAEAVVAAESQSNGRVPIFKVLVISDSDIFPVMEDVKNYFLNASVEINAVDLSKSGSIELKNMVSSPSTEHYFHSPLINFVQSDINDICSILLKEPSQNLVNPFLKVSQLLNRPLKAMTSLFTKESPRGYEYESDATDENAMYDKDAELNKYIEGNSFEYKWSPHPELEPAESVEDVQDTPEELYSADDKKDICKYLHEECNNHMQAGLCSDENAQTQGMKKFCKTTCGFCV